MKKIVFALLIGVSAIVPVAVQQVAAAVVQVTVSKPLYDAEGKWVGLVYRVTADGSAQIIYDDRLITVPAATLSEVDGKLTSSLTKRAITKRRF